MFSPSLPDSVHSTDFNSVPTADLGEPYGLNVFKGSIKFKIPPFWSAVGNKTPAPLRD
jgi:hypothetical protein